MSCKGTCDRIHNGYSGFPKYDSGYKYCAECRYSMMSKEMLCPCCRQTLRRKARHRDRSSINEKTSSISEMVLASLNIDIDENQGRILQRKDLFGDIDSDEQLVKLSVKNDEK